MTSYSIKQAVAPTLEPVSLEEAKKHLRVPTNNEDANIANIYIPAARRRLESELGRQLINATWQFGIDGFPSGLCPIQLPVNPVQSVTSIVYVASDGTETTLGSDDYIVDTNSEPARIKPAWGTAWPATRARTNAQTVLVTFIAGYGTDAASVPAGLREAMFLLIGHYYYHREAVTAMNAKDLPRAVGDLLQAHSYGDEFVMYGGRV